ncbi:MAG: transcription termination factor NusA [Acidimicrobiales bacterium]
MRNPDLMDALSAVAADKGITVDTLFGVLADALESAYKRIPGAHEYAWVTIDPDTAEILVIAQELDEDGEPYGPELDVTPDDFGRIAAQTFRQVMSQRIREAEREMKYEEYAGREGDIVTGIIQQTDSRYTLLDLGRVEALLPQAEQVPYERPEPGARVKAYIVEVRKTAKGPQIVVSRTHPGLIKRLFELEVPEIADGIVEIRACAREPGARTKIAVWSNDANVDPVGACVGARGARVRMVVNELRGEKIDIVPFSDDQADFVAKALSPAKVREVRIDEETGRATVIVPDYQLSLAIGKEGQNAKLAARLTGWHVDIKSETQIAEEEAYGDQDWAEGEWVVDPETGEQVWQPAEGGPAVSAEEWSQAATTNDEDGASIESTDDSTDDSSDDSTDDSTDDAGAEAVPAVEDAADGAEAPAAEARTRTPPAPETEVTSALRRCVRQSASAAREDGQPVSRPADGRAARRQRLIARPRETDRTCLPTSACTSSPVSWGCPTRSASASAPISASG